MNSLFVRLGQFQRVVRPATSSVDQFIPMPAPWAEKETPLFVNFRLGVRRLDFLPAISAFPHGALPSVNTHHSAGQSSQGARRLPSAGFVLGEIWKRF